MARISVLVCDDVAAVRALLSVALEVNPSIDVVGEAQDGKDAGRTKVVVLSGFDSRSIASKARKLGAVSYVEKGIDPFDLAQLVEEVAEAPASGGSARRSGLRSPKAQSARR